MLLAYLRGLLKPDYPHGVRSVLRENLILEKVEIDQKVDLELTRLQLDAAFIPMTDARGAKEILGGIGRTFDKLSQLAEFDLMRAAIPQAKGSVDSLVKIYYALSKAGLVDPVDIPDKYQENGS